MVRVTHSLLVEHTGTEARIVFREKSVYAGDKTASIVRIRAVDIHEERQQLFIHGLILFCYVSKEREYVLFISQLPFHITLYDF